MTADVETLIALRERVLGASGPDRVLDGAILRALPIPEGGWGAVWPDHITWPSVWGQTPWAAPITASLDAALALVERLLPGWIRNLKEEANASHPEPAHAEIMDRHWPDPMAGYGLWFEGHAATMSLALLAALLSALIAEAEAKRQDGATTGAEQ